MLVLFGKIEFGVMNLKQAKENSRVLVRKVTVTVA